MALDRSSDNTHRIGTARFELSGESHAALLTFRARLAAAAEDALPAALAAALDPLAGPEDVLEIDRLEVDLGAIGAAELDVAAIAAAVARAVADAAARARPGRSEPASPPDAEGEAPIRRTELHTTALDALLFYLRTGRLNARSPRRRVAELAALVAETAPGERASHAAAYRAALLVKPGAGPPAAITRLIAAGPSEIVRAILAWLFPQLPAAFGGDDALRAALEKAAGSEAALGALARRLGAFLADAGPRAPTGDDETEGDLAPAGARPAEEQARDEDAGIAVDNAGVVLLHPFLPRLFALADLTEKNRFVDDEARAAAARLIHYLATGETRAEEPALYLPRVLCAVGPEVPILSVEPLAPALIEGADALVHAAIRHWTKLGRASPGALRETFLSRGGVLGGPPRRRRLRVETRGVDVLLGSLPWALDPVRLPWLEAPIGVDWA